MFKILFLLQCLWAAPIAPPIRALPSLERLKQFPLTTIKKHGDILLESDWATRHKPINPDMRAISWGMNLVYQGQVQPIPPERQQMIALIVKQSPQLKGQYQNEIAVSDGQQIFWLPIQNGTLAYFKKDQIQRGEKIFAQTRYFGSYFKDQPQQFFLMLGYRKTLSFF